MSPANAARYWPDGSLMFAVFALRPNFTVPASGSQTIAITTKTGSYPAATRSITTDLYPQGLGIVAPVHSGSPFDATTTWTACVTSGNTNNIRKTRTWIQGDAGDVWSFTVDMSSGATCAASANGAPHGLLAVDFYVHALTDGSGNLGGFRFWADLRQPYVDGPVNGFGGSHPAPVGNPTKDFRIFNPPNLASPSSSTLSWIIGAGPTYTAPTNWPFPTAGVGVTATANTTLTISPNPPQNDGTGPSEAAYYLSGNTFGGFTVGGGDGLYWYSITHGGFFNQPGTTIFGTQPLKAVNNGSGTVTAVPVSRPGARYAIGGSDGEWIFTKGTGSITTDTPLRSGQVDTVAWVKSKVIPPFAVGSDPLAPTAGQILAFTGGGGYAAGPGIFTYWPYCMGSNNSSWAGGWGVNGGFMQYFSPAPVWTTSEFYLGDKTSYFQSLMVALGWGNWLADFVMSTAPNVPPNTGNNKTPAGAARTYVGMGPTVPFASTFLVVPNGYTPNAPNWAWSAPGGNTYNPPTNQAINHIDPNTDKAHQAEFVSWAYLRTGRPELLDRLVGEFAYAVESGFAFGQFNTYTLVPSKTYENVFSWAATTTAGQIRSNTNMMRYIATAAQLYPSDPSGLNNTSAPQVTFDGTQLDKYLFDTVDDNFQLMNDFVDPQYATTLFSVPTNPGAMFTGSISGNTLTVMGTPTGTIAIGQPVADTTGNIAPNTFITSGSGTSWGVQKFVNNTYTNNPQTVGSEAMFSGTPALVANDKELAMPVTLSAYYDRWNLGWGWPMFLWSADPMVPLNMASAIKFIQNFATNYQAYVDRRGGSFNMFAFHTYTGPLTSSSSSVSSSIFGDETQFGMNTCASGPWQCSTKPGGAFSALFQSATGTPSPSTPVFSTMPSAGPTVFSAYANPGPGFTAQNGDTVICPANAPCHTLPTTGMSLDTLYQICDFSPTNVNVSTYTFNLKTYSTSGCSGGTYVTPGGAPQQYLLEGFVYRSNSPANNSTQGTTGELLASYNPFAYAGFAWAKAMGIADPNGYIQNAITDQSARLTASSLGNWIGGTGSLWVDNPGPGVNLMIHN